VRHRLAVSAAVITAFVAVALLVFAGSTPASSTSYDITTLAGKVASLNGTAGLQIRFSALIEEEAEAESTPPAPGAPITPSFVLSSPLDGNSVLPPDVTVNTDTAGAPQNETAIAIDPNNANRIVGGANDYVSRTWSCTVLGTPCSALGEAASGTYFSNDGGQTWCCTSTDPAHIGTIIPGINRLTGGQYDAAGDPSVAFDSQGHVYFAGLGFDRTSPPNTVEVSKGTFSGGQLSWGSPTFINQTTSPSVLNDKEWIAVDAHQGSPFQDRIYVTWTRFLFSSNNGSYIQSPIAFVSSSDGGATFTDPKLISGNVLYGQGSRPVVGPDGTLYVFWNGSTRLASLSSTYMVKSSDGGATWSKPVSISTLHNSTPLHDTAFRVNSYPAAAAAPNGDLYAVWTDKTAEGSVAVYSKSTDGGATWGTPARVFAAATRTPIGYPVSQPSGGTLTAPSQAGAVEDIFPAAGVGPNGNVYLGAYRGDVVSPWQTCAAGPPPPEGRINCTTLGDYIHNTRLDFVVLDLTTNVTNTMSTHPINTRNGFGGGFFGDYNDLAVGSDNVFHAFWTDSNNKQTVVWFYGFEFVPTSINQEDVVAASGNY
jgi:hypothetical protein